MVIKHLISVMEWLIRTWNRIPPPAREKIIAAAVKAMEDRLRELFRAEQASQGATESSLKQDPEVERNVPIEQEHFEKTLTSVVRSAVPALTDKENHTLVGSIFNLLFSENFFKDFLKKTGAPSANESEDAYVARAQVVLTSMLKSRLKN